MIIFLFFAKFISNFIKFYPLLKMIRNIAIYGGSFDPPHKSHIALVKYLKKLPNIDQVWLLPCGDRTDKKLLLSKDVRFRLMNKIFESDPDIKVVDYQIQMCKKLGRMVGSYELLKDLSRKFQNYKFHFVVGGDIVGTVQQWGNGVELKKEFDFIIFQRKGFQILETTLPSKYRICTDQLIEMSSSSLKKILWDNEMSKQKKLSLVEQYLPRQAIQCLKEQKIL